MGKNIFKRYFYLVNSQMEGKQELPAGIVKTQARIAKLYEGNDSLKSTDVELDGISRNLSKMYGRTEEQYC